MHFVRDGLLLVEAIEEAVPVLVQFREEVVFGDQFRVGSVGADGVEEELEVVLGTIRVLCVVA